VIDTDRFTAATDKSFKEHLAADPNMAPPCSSTSETLTLPSFVFFSLSAFRMR